MDKLYIDIGGTYLRSELHTALGVECERVSSQVEDILIYIDKKMKKYPEIDFIGISYAGQVYNGVILSAPNIVLSESKIKKSVELRYGVRLEIENDLNCAVMAEAEYWQTKSVAALFVGTGIGAALIDDARLVRGSKNLAYEIGHIPYKEAPFRCGCGRKNCIELFASGSGISKWLKFFGSDSASDLQLFKESKKEYERTIAKEFETALLHAVGTLVTLANPALLVLGGGIIKDNPYLIKLLKDHLEEFVLEQSLENLCIEVSVLENAPLEGTKLLQERKYE